LKSYLIIILSIYSVIFVHCQSTSNASTISLTAWERFCGCVRPVEQAVVEKNDSPLGSLPVGALDEMGTPPYMEKLYLGIRNDFEHSGTTFEETAEGLHARGVELKRIEDPEKRLRELLIVIDGDVAFPSGKSTLTPKAKELISKIADALAAYPETNCRIGGHTDSVGAFQMNLKLSKDRSFAVKTELKNKHNIVEERFKEVDGYADLRKIVDTMLAEKKNRRTEIYVGTVRIVY